MCASKSQLAEEALRRIDGSTTFGELAVELSQRLNISRRRAAYELFMMWKRGLLDVRPRSPVSKYIWAIATCSIVALSFAAIVAGLQPFKAIFGIFVSYFLVGYLMVEAVYPRGDEIKPTARIGLSIIMSLALEALFVLLLNYSWGLKYINIILIQIIFSIIFLLIAIYRKRKYI